eukprot:scaffold80505_cov34-Phaeocystis_antarctica.AAC.1
MNTIHVVQASALRPHATTHTIPLDATSRMALFTGPRCERRRALSDQGRVGRRVLGAGTLAFIAR